MLEVDKLVKEFGQIRALDDVSLQVSRGEIVGLLGPNGAGKTTLMNIIAGYIFPSAGYVKIDGLDHVVDSKSACARLGYLPERPPLYDDMTIEDYLAFVVALKVPDRRSQKVELHRILDEFQLCNVRGRLLRNLSKGYQQRVGFAQALVGSPPLLILDEPTAGLDPRQIREFRNRLFKLKENHAILFSSHILTEVEAVSDRVVMLNRGRIISDSDTALMGFKYRVITEREDKLTRQALRRVPGVISVEGTIKEDGLFAYDVTANIPDGDSHSIRKDIFLQCQK